MNNNRNAVIKLAIVDDHQIVIDGLKLLLNKQENLTVIAEANSVKAMLQLLKENVVDVLITDIMMPEMNGYELAMIVRKDYPDIKILALSMSESGDMIMKMIDTADVDGYIPKISGKQELLKAIQSIVDGETYFSEHINEEYRLYKKIKTRSGALNITSRELEIIECIIQYLSNKEIANRLFISERTVETHRKNIYRKTDTKGVATLIQFVKENKLLS